MNKAITMLQFILDIDNISGSVDFLNKGVCFVCGDLIEFRMLKAGDLSVGAFFCRDGGMFIIDRKCFVKIGRLYQKGE